MVHMFPSLVEPVKARCRPSADAGAPLLLLVPTGGCPPEREGHRAKPRDPGVVMSRKGNGRKLSRPGRKPRPCTAGRTWLESRTPRPCRGTGGRPRTPSRSSLRVSAGVCADRCRARRSRSSFSVGWIERMRSGRPVSSGLECGLWVRYFAIGSAIPGAGTTNRALSDSFQDIPCSSPSSPTARSSVGVTLK